MLTRSISVCSLIAVGLATAAFGQDTAQKVTFSSKAASAKQVLEKLSKQTGVTFTTSPQTSDEVLLVDVKETPLADLMKQLAKAAAAEWQAEGEGFRLIRSQAMQNQQEREYYESRAAKIRKDQESILEALGKMKALTPQEAAKLEEAQRRQTEAVAAAVSEGRGISVPRMDPAVMNANPTNRLLMKLLAAFNAADLARIGQGSRVVYASMPTRAQRGLPAASQRAISDFVREAEIWLNAMPAPSAGSAPDPSRQIIFGGAGNLQAMQGGLGKVLLVVQRTFFMDAISAELRVADKAGKIVGNASRIIRVGGELPTQTIRAGGAATNPTPAPEPAAPGNPLEISSQAREHASFMTQSPTRGGVTFVTAPLSRGNNRSIAVTATVDGIAVGGGGAGSAPQRLPVSSSWAQTLSGPDQNDPLSYAVSDLFQSLAKIKGRNLVASLPDSALVALSQRAQQRITDAQLLEIAKNNLDLNVEDAESWLNVRPNQPYYVRSVRVDREELGRLLGSIQKDGRLTLDAMSRYALSRTDPAPNPAFDLRYVYTLHPTESGDFQAATSNWRMHQLYSTLSADQRRTLVNGGRLNLGGLSGKQAAIVNSMVYDDPQGPHFVPPPTPNRNEGEVQTSTMVFATEGGMTFSMGGEQFLMNERTEFLPAGVPGNGTLALQLTTSEAALASRKDGSIDPRTFTAEAYGVYQGISPHIMLAGSGGGNNSMPTYDTFRPAVQQTLDFQFEFTPQASMIKQLRDSWFVPGSTAGPYSLMPESFRRKADAEAERMKVARGTITTGDGAARVRPPSP